LDAGVAAGAADLGTTAGALTGGQSFSDLAAAQGLVPAAAGALAPSIGSTTPASALAPSTAAAATPGVSSAPAAGGTATAGAGGGAGTVAGSAVPASVAPSSFSTGDIAAAQGITSGNAGLAPSGASALAPSQAASTLAPGGSSLAGGDITGLSVAGVNAPLAPSGLTAGAGGTLTTPSALTPNLGSLTGDSIGLTSADTSAINATANGSVFNGLTDADVLGGGGSSLGAGSSALGGAGTATTGAATSGGSAAGGGLSASSILGGVKSYAPLLASGVGLLSSIQQGNKQPANYGTLEAQAAQLGSQGNQLQSYLTSGTLPSGVQAGLDQAHQSAEATIKSQYASRGMSGSSAEAQDLANLSSTVVAQGAQIATGLLQQGVSESEFASSIYEQLMNTSIQQDKDLSASIANFAGALGGIGLKALPTG
jgi:hypothetical protein